MLSICSAAIPCPAQDVQGDETKPAAKLLSVEPPAVTLNGRNAKRGLIVTAALVDGRSVDVTHVAGFLTSNPQADDINIENYNLESVEKSVIQKAINKHNGNISKAAKELGLTRASLYRRLEKHGL